MGNPDHLRMLGQGVQAWNAWRQANPQLEIDLGDEILQPSDLRSVDFRDANLSWADLGDADLAGANLTNANLSRTRFYRSDLSGADLTQAGLIHTDFRRANLAGARFREATLAETLFFDTNLANAIGLEECVHLGPSPVDFYTLSRSRPLPKSFLRGCGLPDVFIEYLPSLVEQPIQFYSCFISYSTKDSVFAEQLYDDLQNNGVRCWFAQRDLQGGRKLLKQIDQAIQSNDRLLLILSEASMASEWVKIEIAKARRREIREQRQMLFPIRLVPFQTIRAELTREIQKYFIPDFSRWSTDPASYRTEFERLLRDLKAPTVPGPQAEEDA